MTDIAQSQKLKFSLIRTKLPETLSKRIDPRKDGTLDKRPAANMTRGKIYTNNASLALLAKHLNKNSNIHAVCTGAVADGLPKHPEEAERVPSGWRIVAESDLAKMRRTGEDTTGYISRSKTYIAHPAAPGLGFVDFDDGGMPSALRSELEKAGGVMAVLEGLVPELERVARIERASTSSGIYREEDGHEYSATGLHIYFGVEDAQHFYGSAYEALFKRLIIDGWGWIKISRDGKMLLRTIMDKAVGSPERLIFEAPPELGEGLAQHKEPREAKLIAREGGLLGNDAIPSLSEEEEQEYRDMVSELETTMRGEAETQKASYRTEVRKRLAESGRSASAIDRILEHRDGGEMVGSDMLFLNDSDGEGGYHTILVADVLANIGKYDGKYVRDPVEPDAGASKAIIGTHAQSGGATLYSFLHGGTLWHLLPDAGGFHALLGQYDGGLDVHQAVLDIAKNGVCLDDEQTMALMSAAKSCGANDITILRKEVNKTVSKRRGEAATVADIRPIISVVPPRYLEPIPEIRDRINVVPDRRGNMPADIVSDLLTEQPKLFNRAAGLVWFHRPKGEGLAQYSVLSSPELKSRVQSTFCLQAVGGEGPKEVPPNSDMIGLLRSQVHRFPEVAAVCAAPMIRTDGTLLADEGYHPASRLMLGFRQSDYQGLSEKLEDVPVSQCEDARAMLADDLFDGCHFASTGEVDFAIAGLATAVHRALMPDAAPGVVVHAPLNSQGLGKSTLCELIGAVAGGRKVIPEKLPEDDAEFHKVLVSTLEGDQDLMFFDNAKQRFESNPLASLMTSGEYQGRVLGENTKKSGALRLFVMANGNGLRLGPDLSSRFLCVDLMQRWDGDALQTEPRRVAPVAHALENRHRYIEALLTILKYGHNRIQDGALLDLTPSPTRFTEWDALVRLPLMAAGLADAAEALGRHREEDFVAEGLDVIPELIWQILGTERFQAKDLRRKIDSAVWDDEKKVACDELQTTLRTLPDGRDPLKNDKTLSRYLGKIAGGTAGNAGKEGGRFRIRTRKTREKVSEFWVEHRAEAADLM